MTEPTPTVYDISTLPRPARGGDEVSVPHRARYWHVFGAPLIGSKKGANNFPLFTAGPVAKRADDEVTSTVIQGEGGELFSYLGTFTHEPSEDEINALKPREYR